MNRTLTLAIGMILVFGVTVAVLLQLLPGPRKPTDYLVIGAIATFLCILLLFVVLMSTSEKRPDTFYKRRKPDSEPPA